MAAKPFENRIQNLVYNVDVGIGLRLIKGGLYILFILIVMLYTERILFVQRPLFFCRANL